MITARRVRRLTTVATTLLLLPALTTTPAHAATVIRGQHVIRPDNAFGGGSLFDVGPGDTLRVLFTGVPGQLVRIATGSAYPGDCDARVSVLEPTGKRVQGPVCGGSGVTLPDLRLTASGLHAVVVEAEPGTPAARVGVAVQPLSASAQTLTPNAGPVRLVVPPGRTLEFGFRAESGEYVFAGALAPAPSASTRLHTQLIAPDGRVVAREFITDWRGLDRFEPSVSGVYRLRMWHESASAQRVSFDLDKGRDTVIAAVPGGPAVDAVVGIKGQRARITFEAVAGQRVFLHDVREAWNGPYTASTALVGPGQSFDQVARPTLREGRAGIVEVTGRQTLYVDPFDWTTGSASLRLTLEPAP